MKFVKILAIEVIIRQNLQQFGYLKSKIVKILVCKVKICHNLSF